MIESVESEVTYIVASEASDKAPLIPASVPPTSGPQCRHSRGTDAGELCSSKAKMSATVKGWSSSKGRSDSRGRQKRGAGTSHSLLPDRYNGSNFFST